MTQSKIKRALGFGTLFAAGAITFGLLHYFKAVKYLDIYLALTYVFYFAGVALVFNANYCSHKNHGFAALISIIAGLAMISASIVMLIYGFASGKISFIN